MAESAILVSHTWLQEFIVTALVAMKMSRPIAQVTAGLMVRTDLRGVDSHGATTTVAIGKLSVASRWNKPIPSGWALDDSGTPTTDPFVALKHRLVTPLGGTRDLGSHKGYGLGMMVDILSGVMSGAVYGDLFYRSDRQERRVQDVGHCFAAIDPVRFRPLAEFKHDMDDMFDALKSSPTADGQARIWIAGEPEAETEQTRRRDGIPLAPALVPQCNEMARGLRIPAIA